MVYHLEAYHLLQAAQGPLHIQQLLIQGVVMQEALVVPVLKEVQIRLYSLTQIDHQQLLLAVEVPVQVHIDLLQIHLLLQQEVAVHIEVQEVLLAVIVVELIKAPVHLQEARVQEAPQEARAVATMRNLQALLATITVVIEVQEALHVAIVVQQEVAVVATKAQALHLALPAVQVEVAVEVVEAVEEAVEAEVEDNEKIIDSFSLCNTRCYHC